MKKIVSTLIFMGIVIKFLIFLYFNTTKESEVIISESQIEIKGMYGITIDNNDIISIELKNAIPNITRKVNGGGIGEAKKGKYILDEIGESHLLIHSSKGPYIFIHTEDLIVIINFKDSEKTESLFNDLESVLE